ncbi:uncharacterized protein BJ171DRAFT_510394, partial [Polychytrium aggregatum]|uniref:uncharacterized protein n=1 Tax=Polychytrium aggregatum TaxID=110093 RepID=UPI0022FE019A
MMTTLAVADPEQMNERDEQRPERVRGISERFKSADSRQQSDRRCAIGDQHTAAHPAAQLWPVALWVRRFISFHHRARLATPSTPWSWCSFRLCPTLRHRPWPSTDMDKTDADLLRQLFRENGELRGKISFLQRELYNKTAQYESAEDEIRQLKEKLEEDAEPIRSRPSVRNGLQTACESRVHGTMDSERSSCSWYPSRPSCPSLTPPI